MQETFVDYWMNTDFHIVSAKNIVSYPLPRDNDVNLDDNGLYNIYWTFCSVIPTTNKCS